MKKTKIIATIGPASRNADTLKRLCAAGVNVFRVNFSHGTHEDHGSTIRLIRKVARDYDFAPAILADLQGPKIRTGITKDNQPITLSIGSSVQLIPGLSTANTQTIGIDYANLANEISSGQRIMLNDGAIALMVDHVDSKKKIIACTVTRGGTFSSHKGVNLPNIRLAIPSLTPKDRKDLAFILASDFDYIALSFVRCADDIKKLRRIIDKAGSNLRIIAKIEKPEAVDDARAILDECAGIMVARGDLGVEAALARVPLLQKNLIYLAQKSEKICIVATQMLESMIEHPTPTRAEVSDIAQAILDGTDAIMLSGETATGAYPVEAVATMTEIAETIEASPLCQRSLSNVRTASDDTAHALCEAAVQASEDLSNAPILCFTLSGGTAFTLSHLRPTARIFAFSPSKKARTLLALAHNVIPLPSERMDSMLKLQHSSLNFLKKHGMLEHGIPVIIVGGVANMPGATGFIRVVRS